MREPLVACASCARHVRVSELRCPFCEAELPKASPARGAPLGTFGRAALMIAGATAGAAVPLVEGCSSEPPVIVGDAYGAPPLDVVEDRLIVGDAYGLPPDRWEPPEEDGGDGGDAASDARGDGPTDAGGG